MGKNNIRIGSISPGLTKSEALENNTGPTVAEMVYANTPHLQSKGQSMSIDPNLTLILSRYKFRIILDKIWIRRALKKVVKRAYSTTFRFHESVCALHSM